MPVSDRPGILFVDDDAYMVVTLGNNIMKDLAKLPALSAPVHVFTDPVKAKAFLRKTPPPGLLAAVVDLWMKDKSTGIEDVEAGISVIELLKNRCPGCGIVVLSAHTDTQLEQELRKRFDVRCLRKPASTAEILEELRPSLLRT